jgi:hypothetical protein
MSVVAKMTRGRQIPWLAKQPTPWEHGLKDSAVEWGSIVETCETRHAVAPFLSEQRISSNTVNVGFGYSTRPRPVR